MTDISSQRYNECYLDDAMKNLGEAIDYAVNYQWYSGKYHFSEKYGEQGAKNINKAAASTLVMLAKTLNCEIEDLLE